MGKKDDNPPYNKKPISAQAEKDVEARIDFEIARQKRFAKEQEEEKRRQNARKNARESLLNLLPPKGW